MFKSVHVKNFQSLRDVQVDLAPFTVIVGATDSGKSAFFRAMSTLISNRRGSEFITYGEKNCQIRAELDQGNLTLKRGKSTNDNSYEIEQNQETQTFTKLSGTVPEEVSGFLGIPAKDPLQLASQFDKPYLLDTKEYSSAEAARILGALTNVNILFEGAKESNRRKLESNSVLKTRVSDLESVTSQLEGYEDLSSKLVSANQAELLATQAENYVEMKNQLTSLLENITTARNKRDILVKTVKVNIPNIDELEGLVKAKTDLQVLLGSLKTYQTALTKNTEFVQKYTQETETLNTEYTTILQKKGTCPTCGQTTSSLDSVEL